MKTKKIYQVDAFTETPFKGNPAGVMIVEGGTSKEWMQQMAAEMNLSETAFLQPEKDGFTIRYFTPLYEVPICGHATLASAHIIYELGLVSKTAPILFKAPETTLTINRKGDAITMDFPKYPCTKIATPFQFKESIGFDPIEVYASSYNWIIGIAEDAYDIRTAIPDFELMKKNRLGNLMITAKSDVSEADFVVRCFAPSLGINEDPVTGSAHCALTPLWAGKLGKTKLKSIQVSKRTGNLEVELKENSVEITGNAITVFEGVLKI